MGCRHDWEISPLSIEYQQAFPKQAGIKRVCRKCKKLEYLSNDRLSWQPGARGVLGPPSKERHRQEEE